MMRWSLYVACVLFIAVGQGQPVACADEHTTEEQTTSRSEKKAVAGDIETLIRELDANRFSRRQAASEKLKKLGVAATEGLTKAALGDGREAATRALEILIDQYSHSDEQVKKAAEAALKKIETSEKPAVARRASEALHPKPPPPAPRAMPAFPGQIQIQVQGIAIGQGIQVRNVNGVKTIEAKEKDRTVKIVDDPNNGISVTITETKNNKKTTRQFKAKDAAELKKKHPEAFKAYEKYKGQGGIIQGFMIRPGAALPAIRLQPARVAQPREQKITGQLRDVARQLDQTRDLLKKASGKPGEAARIAEALEQLEKARKTLQEALEKMDK